MTGNEKDQHIVEPETERTAFRSPTLQQHSIHLSEEALATAKRMNPMDDLFFTKMAEDVSVCEEIISTILNVKVKVLSVIPQSTIASLQGRGVRLDALADVLVIRVEAELLEPSPIGEKGAKVNIEVQKDNNDDCQRRVRFISSAVTTNFTPRGTKKFRDIPDVVEIFISAFDIFKEGKVKYEIDRIIKGSGTVVYNGLTEIYVNTAVKDCSTPELDNISGLMELFTTDEYDYEKFPNFSKRKHQFKETEEGVFELSEEIQRLIDKKQQESILEATVSHIKNVMAAFNVTAEKAMEALEIPPNQRGTYAELISKA